MRWSISASSKRAWRNALIALALVWLMAPAPVSAGGVSADRAAHLDHLLRHDCGSCHGMTMKGGLGPALLPNDLIDRDDEGLVQMILEGNPARAMPPWRLLLNKDDAKWIVRRLKHGLTSKELKP